MTTITLATCTKCDWPVPVGFIYCRSHQAKWERSRKRGNSYKHARRARRNGGATENVDRHAVFERDGWQCGICHESIDPKLVVPHPMSATIDHVIPVSKGGDHTYANTRAAHFQCNWQKSDG